MSSPAGVSGPLVKLLSRRWVAVGLVGRRRRRRGCRGQAVGVGLSVGGLSSRAATGRLFVGRFAAEAPSSDLLRFGSIDVVWRHGGEKSELSGDKVLGGWEEQSGSCGERILEIIAPHRAIKEAELDGVSNFKHKGVGRVCGSHCDCSGGVGTMIVRRSGESDWTRQKLSGRWNDEWRWIEECIGVRRDVNGITRLRSAYAAQASAEREPCNGRQVADTSYPNPVATLGQWAWLLHGKRRGRRIESSSLDTVEEAILARECMASAPAVFMHDGRQLRLLDGLRMHALE